MSVVFKNEIVLRQRTNDHAVLVPHGREHVHQLGLDGDVRFLRTLALVLAPGGNRKKRVTAQREQKAKPEPYARVLPSDFLDKFPLHSVMCPVPTRFASPLSHSR